MKNEQTINIVDIEATCWDSEEEKQNNYSEIIEIGIVQLDLNTGKLNKQASILIKPQFSSVSPFCTKLTTITQQLVDEQGISFQEACTQLKEQFNSHNLPWASYGKYDYNKLRDQSKVCKVNFPFTHDHTNIKKLFSSQKNIKPIGMAGALKICGFELQGTHHRGLDDAINISKIYWSLVLDGKITTSI